MPNGWAEAVYKDRRAADDRGGNSPVRNRLASSRVRVLELIRQIAVIDQQLKRRQEALEIEQLARGETDKNNDELVKRIKELNKGNVARDQRIIELTKRVTKTPNSDTESTIRAVEDLKRELDECKRDLQATGTTNPTAPSGPVYQTGPTPNRYKELDRDELEDLTWQLQENLRRARGEFTLEERQVPLKAQQEAMATWLMAMKDSGKKLEERTALNVGMMKAISDLANEDIELLEKAVTEFVGRFGDDDYDDPYYGLDPEDEDEYEEGEDDPKFKTDLDAAEAAAKTAPGLSDASAFALRGLSKAPIELFRSKPFKGLLSTLGQKLGEMLKFKSPEEREEGNKKASKLAADERASKKQEAADAARKARAVAEDRAFNVLVYETWLPVWRRIVGLDGGIPEDDDEAKLLRTRFEKSIYLPLLVSGPADARPTYWHQPTFGDDWTASEVRGMIYLLEPLVGAPAIGPGITEALPKIRARLVTDVTREQTIQLPVFMGGPGANTTTLKEIKAKKAQEAREAAAGRAPPPRRKQPLLGPSGSTDPPPRDPSSKPNRLAPQPFTPSLSAPQSDAPTQPTKPIHGGRSLKENKEAKKDLFAELQRSMLGRLPAETPETPPEEAPQPLEPPPLKPPPLQPPPLKLPPLAPSGGGGADTTPPPSDGDAPNPLFAAIQARRLAQEERSRRIASGELKFEDPRQKALDAKKKAEKKAKKMKADPELAAAAKEPLSNYKELTPKSQESGWRPALNLRM